MKYFFLVFSSLLTPVIGNSQCDLNFSQLDLLCNGICEGTATTIPTGMAPFSFDWSTGDTTATIDSLCAGTYYLTLTDDVGCEVADSVIITEPDPIVISIDSIMGTSGPGWIDGDVYWSLDGGIAPYILTWYYCGTDTIYDPFDMLGPYFGVGSYYAIIIDDMGCTDTSDCAVISAPVAGLEGEQKMGVVVYPNPNNGKFYVSFEGESSTVCLYDSFGKLVLTQNLNEGTTEINSIDLAPGVYYLRLTGEVSAIKRVVVR